MHSKKRGRAGRWRALPTAASTHAAEATEAAAGAAPEFGGQRCLSSIRKAP
jgi:hypothetical protein